MKCSMQDYVKVVASCLSPDLVSSEALSNIYKLAQMLPPFSNSVLECHLGTDVSRVDLSVSLANTLVSLPEILLIHPVWRQCQELGRDMADIYSDLRQRISESWLEFDVDGPPSSTPIPCILLCVNQEAVSDVQSLLETALNLLEFRLSSPLRFNLKQCLDTLPANAKKFIGIGAMLSRPSDDLRLILQGISPYQIPAYLAQNGWIGSVEKLEEIISLLSIFADKIFLSCDIGNAIGSRIGLECYFKKAPKYEPRWELLLQHLVATGLCTSSQRDAILAWSGESECALGIFSRFITHIKVVYQPGIPLEAKVYLGLCHNL